MKKKVFVSVFALIMMFGFVAQSFAGSIIYGAPMDEATAAMESNDEVKVTKTYVWSWAGSYWTFSPRNITPSKGLIIYPGALIDPRAYAVLAQGIAREGYLVVIPSMLFNLAIASPNRADKIIDTYDDIDTWVISGHSLGGVMACNYAGNNQSTIDGVILYASYPSEDYRIDDTNLSVLSIYGTNDGLTSLDDIDASVAHLPADAEFYEIAGGNHSQFAYYKPESANDNSADISREEQHAQMIDASINLLGDL